LVKTEKVRTFEIVGTIRIILLGSALHFTFELSYNNRFVGIFSAVNESVWEHMKLAFWPSILWMLITIIPLRNSVNNYFVAKAVGTYVMVFLIPATFYSYTSFTGESIFLIDIAIFVVAIVVGQFFSYRLFNYKKLPSSAAIIAIIALVMLAAAFVLFTFYPPHVAIFRDSITNQYGIPSK
jgi:hypothetical protein